MSSITLWWHMMIKGNVEYTIQSLDSLQGLYDGMVIAVDDGPDSDEVYEVLSHYPNTYLFRDHLIDFAHTMQAALDRIPTRGVDYIGRSDGDEVLVTKPYEIRKWLAETRPDSVNCATHYLYTIGWCKAGETYRNESVRIWKYGTRKWGNPVHQYPYVISGEDKPVIADITFDHIKNADPLSMVNLNIKFMQREIDRGNREYLWYIAKEYVVKGDIDKAISLCFEYLKGGIGIKEHFDRSLWGMSELSFQQKDYDGFLKRLQEITNIVGDYPKIEEYRTLAIQMRDANKGGPTGPRGY
jgi:hypothetical protein